MDLAEGNRLIAVTKGFRCLQGLSYAPMGIVILAEALFLHPESSPARFAAVLALIPIALAASFAASWYYRRRFGVVRCQEGVRFALLVIVRCGVIFGTLFGALYLDGAFYRPPFVPYPGSLTCLWWAAAYLILYLVPYRLRPHSLWFAIVFLGLALLTLMGEVPKDQFYLGSGRAGVILTGNVFIWSAAIVHSLLDHLRLLRLLPKAPQEAMEPSGNQHG